MKNLFYTIFLLILLGLFIGCNNDKEKNKDKDSESRISSSNDLSTGKKIADIRFSKPKIVTPERKIILEEEIIQTPRIIPVQTSTIALKNHRIEVNINNQNSTVKIIQSLKNTGKSQLEGTFIFPLPKEASVSKFSMSMDGKMVTGKVLDKNEANVIYQSIVRRLKDPGILEYVGTNLFKARIFPIPAGKETKIEIEYTGLLPFDNNLVKFTYPLSYLKRFSRIEGPVVMNFNLDSHQKIKSIYSPTHKISTNIKDEHSATISYEGNSSKLNDFIMYYSLSDSDIALNMLAYNDGSEDNYFMLIASPDYIDDKDTSIKKDVIFIMDSSGSMEGEKMKQAKEAAKFVLRNLNSEDRFRIIDFDDEIRIFGSELKTASKDNIDEGLQFISKVEAAGSTNIHDALIKSMNDLSFNRPTYILFLTDGLPTSGNTNEKDIIKHVANKSDNKMRLFSFGVGYDVNTHLLDSISERNHGLSQYVEPDENIEASVSSLYKKVSKPALSNVDININGINTKYVYPKDFSDMFYGTQLIMVGRYSGNNSTNVVLKGNVNDSLKTFNADFVLNPNKSSNDFLPRLWSERRIGYLLDEIRLNGESKELVDEIKKLSIKYGIVTPYTSYLITKDEKEEEKRIVRPRNRSHPTSPKTDRFSLKKGNRNMPSSTYVDSTADTEAMPYERMDDDALGGFSTNTLSKKSSRSAVKLAEELQQSKSKEQVSHRESSDVKTVSDKTFYLKHGYWVDSEYKEEMKVIKIKFGSDKYFKLISKHQALTKYLSVGKNVIIVYKGTAYKISE